MKSLLALALLVGSSPATQPTVETANADWSNLPLLQHRGYSNLDSKVMAKIHELVVVEHRCDLPRVTNEELDFRMSFAAQFTPDGQLKRLILPPLNCPEAESVLGGALLEMMEGGDYRPTGKNPEGWYRGVFGFVFS